MQKKGGLADLWYMNDGDILCHPIFVPSDLQEFDVAVAKVGAERNWMQRLLSGGSATCRIWPKSPQLPLEASHLESLSDLDSTSRTSSWAKADVIRAVHERVQLCQDPQTEFALLQDSLGVSRINHNLRVHSHTILQETGGCRNPRRGGAAIS